MVFGFTLGFVLTCRGMEDSVAAVPRGRDFAGEEVSKPRGATDADGQRD